MRRDHGAQTRPPPVLMVAHRLYNCPSSIYLLPLPVKHLIPCGWPPPVQRPSQQTHSQMKIRKPDLRTACPASQEMLLLMFLLRSNKREDMLGVTDLIHPGVMLKTTRFYVTLCLLITLDSSIHYVNVGEELVRHRSVRMNWQCWNTFCRRLERSNLIDWYK